MHDFSSKPKVELSSPNNFVRVGYDKLQIKLLMDRRARNHGGAGKPRKVELGCCNGKIKYQGTDKYEDEDDGHLQH
ncbi:hypothetical protein GH714_028566 [Hevea brasiliensis]|uniref:Uncharacterized protein n=1 Tax=Hevea brasiliensis TaxID=3981 RepID=A0A6A6NJQ6_HEVBR|nr:hypothetical protein GH714_028566 [Hevea brasiliensis]